MSERYIEEYASSNKKASSVHTDKSNLRNHIVPYFGDMLAKDVAIEDINRFMSNLAEGKMLKTRSTKYKGGAVVKAGRGVANRCRALLSKMFNLAEKWRVIPINPNPVRHSTQYKEESLENYLSPAKIGRLWDILEEKEIENNYSIYLINAIRLLMLTGARVGEIQTLEWEHIDQTRKTAFLPDSKSGKKPLFLSDAALKVINSSKRIKDNPYVFPGKNDQSPIINFNKPWGKVRADANLEGIRLHDLRHAFASEAMNAGIPLALVGGLLGHKSLKTTNAMLPAYIALATQQLRQLLTWQPQINPQV